MYYLEKKNGELVQHSLPLNENAEVVLASLSKALESTGLVVMNPPQSPVHGDKMSAGKLNEYFLVNKQIQREGINHIYDINTNRGRDFIYFIKNIDKQEIEHRKADRIDASAAALVARQAFKFKSIDGTGLGWSSASLAKCLKTLTKVYDEHTSKFRVNSFYPLQLILSNDEFHKKLDLFGGRLMLNPGSTPNQWLETLITVTEDNLHILKKNREELEKNLLIVQNGLNVKIRKGFSCLSGDYFYFLKRMAEQIIQLQSGLNHAQSLSKSLALNRIGLVVEADQACRRPIVTHNGEVMISSRTEYHVISSSLVRLRSDALQNVNKETEKKCHMKEIENILKYQYGFTKVYKHRFSKISSDEYIHALSKLLKSERVKEIKQDMAGNSIGIIGGGHCRLADDGSFLIPWDWH